MPVYIKGKKGSISLSYLNMHPSSFNCLYMPIRVLREWKRGYGIVFVYIYMYMHVYVRVFIRICRYMWIVLYLSKITKLWNTFVKQWVSCPKLQCKYFSQVVCNEFILQELHYCCHCHFAPYNIPNQTPLKWPPILMFDTSMSEM